MKILLTSFDDYTGMVIAIVVAVAIYLLLRPNRKE